MSKNEKAPMKTLANCTPVEFLRQANKIRHAAAGFVKETGVLEIRKHRPELTGKETDAEKAAAMETQAKKNLSDMADCLMDANAEKTAELLGMLCFMSPEETAQTKGIDFLTPAIELLNSRPVIDFLLSLAKLEQTITDA